MKIYPTTNNIIVLTQITKRREYLNHRIFSCNIGKFCIDINNEKQLKDYQLSTMRTTISYGHDNGWD